MMAAMGGHVGVRIMDLAAGVIMLVLMYGPFLAAIVTIIWLGVRGKPAWSAPLCAACKYDLRGRDPSMVVNCPECGANLKGPRSVLFMKGMGRRWGLIAWGVVLLLLPVLGVAAAMGISRLQMSRHASPSNLRAMSTQQLLTQQLPGRMDEPWVWNELERRATAGTLTQPEAEDAITQFTQHMTASKPSGWDQPLHWQDDFLKSATAAGLVSDRVLLDFCDAYYGTTPTLQPMHRLRVGQDRTDVNVRFGSTWDGHHGLDVRLVWDVKQVLIDGKPVEAKDANRYSDRWSGSINVNDLAAGDHQIEVELDCVLAPSASLLGVTATSIPVANVPNPWRRWTTSAKQTFTVYAQQATLVNLVDDPARNPTSGGAVAIARLVVEPRATSRKRLTLAIKAEGVAIPCSFDATIEAGEQRWTMGGWTYADLAGHRRSSGTQLSVTLNELDSTITTARVTFTPNPKHIERWPDVTEIWGKPIVFEGVPIDRLDLPPGAETGP